MAVGDVYRLALEATPDDQNTMVNVFHYRQTVDIPGSPDVENLIDAFIDDALPAYQALMYTGFAFRRIVVAQVTGGIEVAERNINVNGTDVDASDFLPYQCAAVITFKTGMAGRSRRGRMYVFTAKESKQNAGHWVVPYQDLLQDLGDALLTITESVLGSTFELVVWSEVLMAATTVTNPVPRAVVYTQRRRTPGVGS